MHKRLAVTLLVLACVTPAITQAQRCPILPEVTSPENGAKLSSIKKVNGLAGNQGCLSTVNKVNLFIRSKSTQLFWNGKKWVPAPGSAAFVWLPTSLSSSTWSKSTGFPKGKDLPVGTYFIGVHAIGPNYASDGGKGVSIDIE